MSTDEISTLPAPLPIPNSYWVEAGRLLAGEYPGAMSRAEATERVQKLLRAGVSSFIDLTEEGELPAYEGLLAELSERPVRYQRLSILDHGLPESPARMARILDAIAAELEGQRCVYVHCRAGIGRTGMTIGCHLVRSGLANEAALERLQVLWQQCARSRRWHTVPETHEQVEFVLRWREPLPVRPGGMPGVAARYEGALLGLAVGDALGTLVAASNFDAATLATAVRDAATLATGADTAMTRALAESLLTLSVHDPADQMQRYLQWMRSAVSVAVPPELKRALAAWQWSRKPNAGSHDPKNLDPHSLARTLAVALFLRNEPAEAIELAAEVSRTSQQSPLVLDLCRLWAALFIDALSDLPKDVLLACAGPAMAVLRGRTLKEPVRRLLEQGWGGSLTIAGDALAVTEVAIASFAKTATLRDALLHLETSTRAAPAAAALCGALAGAHYGVEAVPADWRRQLPEDALLRSLARHLLS